MSKRTALADIADIVVELPDDFIFDQLGIPENDPLDGRDSRVETGPDGIRRFYLWGDFAKMIRRNAAMEGVTPEDYIRMIVHDDYSLRKKLDAALARGLSRKDAIKAVLDTTGETTPKTSRKDH
jgi:hypothetical protein